MGKVDGKVAVVTGGARGIGKAIVEKMCEEGATGVVIADFNTETGKATEKEFKEKGWPVAYIQADVSSESDWQKVVEFTTAQFGKIDILVNDAAKIGDGHGILELDAKAVRSAFEVDVMGTLLGTEYVSRQMKSQGTGGSIVNMSSGHVGKYLPTGGVDYPLCKAAIREVTKIAARQLGQFNIRCNCVSPGLVATELHKETCKRLGVDENAFAGDKTALGRMTEPSEIASVIIWLCSNEATQATGANFQVDGGYGIVS